MNRLSKRFLPFLLCFLLCCSLLPTAAFAADEPSDEFLYGITSTDKENEITVSQLAKDSPELNDIKEEAAPIGYGYHIISVDESGLLPVPAETESGYCRSPFTLMSEKSIAAFTMDAPELNEYETVWKKALELGFVLAVEDNASGYVAFYPPKKEDNDTLTFEIPVRKEGVTCAVLLTPGVTTQQYPSLESNELKPVDDPNDVATHHYTWNFTIDIGEESVFKRGIGQSSIQILSPEGIAVVADSVKLTSEFFEEIDPASIRQDGTGVYTIPLTVKEEYIGEVITGEGREAAGKPMSFSFDIDISSSVSPGEFLISTKLTVPPDGEGGSAPLVANAPLIVGDVVAFVSITPADMTIYEGGIAGYDGVVDEKGEKITSTSFPEPLFKIELPKSIEGDPTVLVFTNNTTNNSWNVEEAGEDSDGTAYYRLVNKNDSGTPIRVQFIDKDGNVTESDTVDLNDEVYDTYDIAIFSGNSDEIKVSVKDSGSEPYDVSRNFGKLIVRAVENKTDPTSDIVATDPTTKLGANTAIAVAPADTTYTLNDTGVKIPEVANDSNPDGSKPSLLFDDIITSDGVNRIDALENAVDTKLGTTNGTRNYVAKYLDLVDANNGNAWISSSAGTDIYWGYPATTDKNTNFTLVHFKDLHRDTSGNGTTGFDPDDIDSDNVDVLTAETGGIENTEYGIKFHVDKGGFSPFVLVWEAKPEPEPEPEPEPTPPPYIPPVDPDDTGVSDLLNTEDHIQYLFGYPERTFGPENDMTRAEVAQMFYNLLLDQDVEITKTFDDVPEDAWYAKAVNTLASLGVVSGVGDNKFEPNRSITRAEFTTMAMKFAVGGEEGENIFSDVDKDDWFYKAVVDSIQYGWIHGYPDGTFRPNNPITRAEVTAIVNNMLGRAADEDFVDEHAEELTPFSDIEKHWAYYHIVEATNDHDYTKPSSGENWTRLN